MKGFTITEVVEMALQTERLGYKFYTTMSKRFKKQKELKELFDILAKMEKAHENRFESLKDFVIKREPEDWQEAQKYFRAIMESEFFIGKRKSLPSMSNIKTERDAVELAIGFEKETLLFYIGLRGEIREKHILDEIIKEEQSHITWLTSILGRMP